MHQSRRRHRRAALIFVKTFPPPIDLLVSKTRQLCAAVASLQRPSRRRYGDAFRCAFESRDANSRPASQIIQQTKR